MKDIYMVQDNMTNGEIRATQVNVGDRLYFSKELLYFSDIKLGAHLTIAPDRKLWPVITTSYNKMIGKFVVIAVHKTKKKWWQFWKKRSLTGVDIECIAS